MLVRVLVCAVAALTVMPLASCAVLGRLMPGDPWLPTHVVNRDGAFFVGSRCKDSFVEAGVFLQDPWNEADHSADFDLAIWHAVALQGVPEFDLFASNQPGVSVIADNGTRPESSELTVYIGGTGGYQEATTVIIGLLGPGQVRSYAGLMTWDEFMKLPKSDFGCQ